MLVHCTYCVKETPQEIVKLRTIADNGVEYMREYMRCLNCGYPYWHCSDYNIKEEQKALQDGKN